MLIGFTEEEEVNLRSKKPSLENVQKVLDIYEFISKSPAFSMKIAYLIQTQKWIGETIDKPTSIKDKDDKGYEYSLKMLLAFPELMKVADEINQRLTKEQIDNAQSEAEKSESFGGSLELVAHKLNAERKESLNRGK